MSLKRDRSSVIVLHCMNRRRRGKVSAVGLPAVEPRAAAPPPAGIRVLDFTHIVAGPFCTRILADLGAEVLHVETRSRAGGLGFHPDVRDPRVHRSKKSITLNLKHEGGRAAAIRLAGVTDVI